MKTPDARRCNRTKSLKPVLYITQVSAALHRLEARDINAPAKDLSHHATKPPQQHPQSARWHDIKTQKKTRRSPPRCAFWRQSRTPRPPARPPVERGANQSRALFTQTRDLFNKHGRFLTKHGRFPTQRGRSPINHGRLPIKHGRFRPTGASAPPPDASKPMPLVGIIMGSDSDLPCMKTAAEVDHSHRGAHRHSQRHAKLHSHRL